jgi:CRISPR-associated endonuclease Cas1
MEAVTQGVSTVSDGSWAERAAYWTGKPSPDDLKKLPRQNPRTPLILTGHGVHLRINHGALEIKNGFTHYPQKREEWRFFRGDPKRPSRIILLDGTGAITLDVLAWLSEQEIPLIRLDYRGQVVTAIGASGIGADPKLVHLQLAANQSSKRSMAIATFIVREKLIRSRETLDQYVPASAAREIALARLDTEIDRLKRPWSGTKVALLGVEGKCAQMYFDVWRDLRISWKGTAKKPIPDAWRIVGPRRSRLNDGTRGASHPVQAILNYAYGVLESQIRIETAGVGLDPSIGFLHELRQDRAALVLDLLEPVRPAADRMVLRFIAEEAFSAGDFAIGSNGICRLHPQLARRVVCNIEPTKEIRSIFAELIKRLGHKPPPALPHRSRAWLAQRGLLVGAA